MSWGQAVVVALKWWGAMLLALFALYIFIVAAILFPIPTTVFVLVAGFAITVWAVRL